MSAHTPPTFEYVRPPELSGERADVVHPVVIVGAGPVGLACAIDLRSKGVEALILDDNNTVSVGSRAICYAKRTLEILDRLGCGDPVVDKGIGWQVGKVFHRDRLAYQFNLLPESGHKRPAFVNLQQYYLEEAMLARLHALGGTVRWKSRVVGIAQDAAVARVTVETPDGQYTLAARYVIAADGARSTLRDLMGLAWHGQVFRDRFLIADVHMRGDFPTERWFWFDPPFHPNQSVLLHRQADDVWRIDFQLGWDADPEEEKKPEKVIPRIRAMLGDDRPVELEWVSVYTFQCRRLDRFVHGRVIFAGDAAHQVSPFGARGANSGIQDADNLCWKLARVLDGTSPPALLETYDAERVEAADENILNSTRSTDFITPKSPVSRVFRDAVLDLAECYPFARKLVNSGRLSAPTHHAGSALSTPDRDAFDCALRPGSPAADAPVRCNGADTWLCDLLDGRFGLLYFAEEDDAALLRDLRRLADSGTAGVRIDVVVPPGRRRQGTDVGGNVRVIEDLDGLVAQRYAGAPGTLYLVRPDQHVAGRWRRWSAADVTEALDRAAGLRLECGHVTEHGTQSRAA